MHSQRRILVAQAIAALALCACGSQLSEAPTAELQPASTETEQTSPATEMAANQEAHESAPLLTLLITKHHNRITLALQNRGRTNVRFNSNVLLESGANAEPQRLSLRLDEARPLPSCAELAPGALLELEATPSAGEHRFVLTSCDGNARIESESFAL